MFEGERGSEMMIGPLISMTVDLRGKGSNTSTYSS